jgi:hypothetical protein
MPLPEEDILHQADVEAVIAEVIEETVGADNAAITNASVAHALNATFSDTEVEAALNALGGKINSILAALRANGIVDAT